MSGVEHLFSARFACPICSYSLAELEPRLFSFNNPMGACPRCDGLGQITFFDPKRVVAFPDMSLAAGAIKGWDHRNQFYFQMLGSLAQHYGFDVDTPFEQLPETLHDLILNGSGRDKIRFPYSGERGNKYPARASIRRHSAQSGTALSRNRFRRGARRTGEISRQSALPRMRGHASAPRSAHMYSSPDARFSNSAACR